VSGRQAIGVAIVVICIGVPLIEAFDRWDQTLQDGNDSEANVVVAALCVGLALSSAHAVVARLFRAPRSGELLFQHAAPVMHVVITTIAAPTPTRSPPIALRI